jgi:beta-glucosidase
MVLLKNEATRLPLARGTKLAVIGPLADSPVDQMGCWTFDGKADDVVTPLAALRRLCGPALVRHAPGLTAARSSGNEGFSAAVEAALASDVCVVFVGEDMALSGEARCRAFLDLPGGQQALLEALAATGKPIVLVVMAGRPLTLAPALALADAVLWAWHPGTMGGPAIADLLLGVCCPSGKLPISFPRAVGQIPIYYAHKNSGRPPKSDERGIPLGTPLDPKDYSCSHMDVEQSPQFPFGHGLSYTSFEYGALELDTSTLQRGQSLLVSVQLRNTGNVSGAEIVQLYVRDRVASVTRPVRELKRFARVELAPGEMRRVELSLHTDDLAFVGQDMKWRVEPGKFELWVGGSSRAELGADFTLV